MQNEKQTFIIDIVKLQKALTQNINTSYKLFWAKSIIICHSEMKNIYLIDDIIHVMIIEAWTYVFDPRFVFPKQDHLPIIVNMIRELIPNIQKKSELKVFLETTDNKEVRAKMYDIKNIVPYRFLRGFLEEQLKELKPKNVDKTILELSKKSDEVLYKFCDRDNIYIDIYWHRYISYKKAGLIEYIDALIEKRLGQPLKYEEYIKR
ncbi:MAG: hypothetical protein ATN31_10080 [Candidatus Epulonipiscioides saccharophilum]|nr:MAG: hypothetical protein ATN31_10080 [Epulopiscium sp. AS2M-Bin001]